MLDFWATLVFYLPFYRVYTWCFISLVTGCKSGVLSPLLQCVYWCFISLVTVCILVFYLPCYRVYTWCFISLVEGCMPGVLSPLLQGVYLVFYLPCYRVYTWWTTVRWTGCRLTRPPASPLNSSRTWNSNPLSRRSLDPNMAAIIELSHGSLHIGSCSPNSINPHSLQ